MENKPYRRLAIAIDISITALREALRELDYVPLPVLHVWHGDALPAADLVKSLRVPLHIKADLYNDQDEWYIEWMGDAVGSEGP